MKTKIALLASLLALNAVCLSADFAIDWFTVDGGGRTSSGGPFSVSGTIGQPDAGLLTGRQFSLAGGFWSTISVVQTPGAPRLSIQAQGAALRISWPAPATGFVLEQTTNVLGPWSPVSPPYATNASEISFSQAPSSQMQFYRLWHP